MRHAFRVPDNNYRILGLLPGATIADIKAAYKKLALKLHPDHHEGCEEKRAEFQKVTEAYEEVLVDAEHRKQRRKRFTYNVNYRKVYAPHPPPEWDFVWDHKRHQDMHYGDGIQREEIERVLREEKPPEYHSQLGKGFSFHVNEGKEASTNPYAKHTPQGSPSLVVEYEEGVLNANTGVASIRRKNRIIRDVHDRRAARHKSQAQSEEQEQQEKTQYSQYDRFRKGSTFVGSVVYPKGKNTKGEECIIL